MKTLLFAALTALLPASVWAQATRLTGTTGEAGSGSLLLDYQLHGQPYTDTIRTRNGSFSYSLAQGSDDGTARLSRAAMPGAMLTVWLEPGTVQVKGAPGNDFTKSEASGTPENEATTAYTRFIRTNLKPPAEHTKHVMTESMRQQVQLTCDFARTHPAALTSALMLLSVLPFDPEKPVAELQEVFNGLTPAVRQSVHGKQLAKQLALRQAQPQPGQVVPDLTLADTTGTRHSLATYRGGYVLLDFWGHWCHACLEAMPQVVALHGRYGQKLTIIGVALEQPKSTELWKQAIRQHHVPGLQLADFEAEKGPIAATYHIQAFPTYMLLDSSGRLLYRVSDVEELTARLAQEPALR